MNTIANERSSMPTSRATRETNFRNSFLSSACVRCLFRMTKSSAGLAIRLPELEWLLAREVLCIVRLVCTNDALNERMTNDISLVEVDKRNALHARDHITRFDQTRHLTQRKIDLGDVSSDYSFTAITDAGQEHFHLLGSRILRLVQNHKRI